MPGGGNGGLSGNGSPGSSTRSGGASWGPGTSAIGSADALGIDIDEQLNINGGAIALGHPFGMTGSRIMTTLINSLHDADKQFGLETMCVGGGQGMAMLIERL